jgi:hypothetical protein
LSDSRGVRQWLVRRIGKVMGLGISLSPRCVDVEYLVAG